MQRIGNFFAKHFKIVLGICFGGIVGILVFAYYNCKTYESSVKEVSDLLTNPKVASYIFNKANEINKDEDSITLEQQVEYLRCQQLYVIERQSELVNDFRQEMNNNINKMNTWIGLALGLMSIIGVFVPILYQIKIRSIEKDDFENYKKTILSKIKDQEKTLKKDIDQRLNMVRNEWDDKKNEFEKQQVELYQTAHFQNLLADSNKQLRSHETPEHSV